MAKYKKYRKSISAMLDESGTSNEPSQSIVEEVTSNIEPISEDQTPYILYKRRHLKLFFIRLCIAVIIFVIFAVWFYFIKQRS